MDLLTSCNICVNAITFPGSLMDPTYSSGYTSDLKGRFSGLKLLFIPFDFKSFTCFNYFNAPKYIPALLHVAENNQANVTVIHFHGNACDIGEVGVCAQSEGYTLMAHYLVVEFPRFGVADGFPSEPVINQMALAVHDFVVNKLSVPHDRIVILGRSIGTGPACYLAAHLETQQRRPAAVVLHAPYCSLRSAAYDLLGCFSFFFLDRWENWKKLCVADGTAPSSSSSYNQSHNNNQRISLSSQEVTLSVNGETSERTHSPPKDTLSHVIGCPVLFIHADNDKIIDVHHSEMMHRHRQASGLPSTIFIQKSTEKFAKGHNFFLYGEDVVMPIRDFLYDNVPSEKPHSLPLDVVDRLTLVPSDLVAFESARQKNCSSAACVSRVAMCPCIFGLEASCALCVLGWNEAYLAVGGDPPPFQYETKQSRGKEHLNGIKLIAGLLRLQQVEHLIIEHPPKRDDPPDLTSPVENPLTTTTVSVSGVGGNTIGSAKSRHNSEGSHRDRHNNSDSHVVNSNSNSDSGIIDSIGNDD